MVLRKILFVVDLNSSSFWPSADVKPMSNYARPWQCVCSLSLSLSVYHNLYAYIVKSFLRFSIMKGATMTSITTLGKNEVSANLQFCCHSALLLVIMLEIILFFVVMLNVVKPKKF
jgi:hypothetical protein